VLNTELCSCLDAMAVQAPPSAGWHKPEGAAALEAYSAAVAFESVCAIGRVQLVACGMTWWRVQP
jgi:hypothetical protein